MYQGPIITTGGFNLYPVTDGPFRKNLGNIRVQATQEATSSAAPSHIEYDEYLIEASEAFVNNSTGKVSLSLSAPHPEPPNESNDWTFEQWSDWSAKHQQHCWITPGSRSFEGGSPVTPEPRPNAHVVMERGHEVSVSTSHFDRSYWVGRDGTVESVLDRFSDE